MTNLLMSCKTLQSSKQKTMVVATDTTAVTQVATQDSASIIARVDSIIIEEYDTDKQVSITPSVNQDKTGLKCPSQKRNDTSQKGTGSIKKKTKIYGASLSSTWLSKNDSLNKNIVHKEKTDTQIRQKTPMPNNAGRKKFYAIIAIAAAILIGYLIWKIAVQ